MLYELVMFTLYCVVAFKKVCGLIPTVIVMTLPVRLVSKLCKLDMEKEVIK